MIRSVLPRLAIGSICKVISKKKEEEEEELFAKLCVTCGKKNFMFGKKQK